jgi:hypothetical protein
MALESFHLFPELPVDLWIIIWHFDDVHEIRERGSGRDRWEAMYLLVLRTRPQRSSLMLELRGNAPGQYVRRGYASREPREYTHIIRSFQGPLEERSTKQILGSKKQQAYICTGLPQSELTLWCRRFTRTALWGWRFR